MGLKLPDKVVAYHNPYFQRDAPELVKHIRNHSRPAKRRRAAYDDQALLASSLQQNASMAPISRATSAAAASAFSHPQVASKGSARANQAVSSHHQIPSSAILDALQGRAQSQPVQSILDQLGNISGSFSETSRTYPSAALTQTGGLQQQQQGPPTLWSVLQQRNIQREGQGVLDDQQMLMQSLIQQGERHRQLQERAEQQRLLELSLLKRGNQQIRMHPEPSPHQRLAAAAQLEQQERQRLMMMSPQNQIQQERTQRMQQLLQHQQAGLVGGQSNLDFLLQRQQQHMQTPLPGLTSSELLRAYEEALQRQTEQKQQDEDTEERKDIDPEA